MGFGINWNNIFFSNCDVTTSMKPLNCPHLNLNSKEKCTWLWFWWNVVHHHKVTKGNMSPSNAQFWFICLFTTHAPLTSRNNPIVWVSLHFCCFCSCESYGAHCGEHCPLLLMSASKCARSHTIQQCTGKWNIIKEISSGKEAHFQKRWKKNALVNHNYYRQNDRCWGFEILN